MLTIPETVSMNVPRYGEVFTHKDDDGILRAFTVTMMREFAEKHGKGCADIALWQNMKIDPAHVAHTRKNMGIEQARLDRLCEPYLSRPLIAIVFGVDEERMGIHLSVVDGNHRMVKKHELGHSHVAVYCFMRRLWEQFASIIPADEKMLTGESGVIENEQLRSLATGG